MAVPYCRPNMTSGERQNLDWMQVQTLRLTQHELPKSMTFIELLPRCLRSMFSQEEKKKKKQIILIKNILFKRILQLTGLRSQCMIFSLYNRRRHFTMELQKRLIRLMLKPLQLFFLISSYKLRLKLEEKRRRNGKLVFVLLCLKRFVVDKKLPSN